jgi:hypothetical protein
VWIFIHAQTKTNKQTLQMKFNNILSVGAACSVLVAAGLQAQETEESPFSFSASLDYNSHFISSGLNVWGGETEDIGDEWLFQPSVGAEYALTDSSAVYVGAWFDINGVSGAGAGDVGPDLGGDTKEMDLWLGYYFSVDKFTFDFTYQSWLYAGENEGIFDVVVSYDTMFAPYVKFHNRFEVVDYGQEKGTIMEIGGTLYEGEYESISYGISAGLAFSLTDYHVAGEDGYTYSFIGSSASKVIYSTDAVEVDLHGGLTLFHTAKVTTGNARSNYLTANVGVGFSF